MKQILNVIAGSLLAAAGARAGQRMRAQAAARTGDEVYSANAGGWN